MSGVLGGGGGAGERHGRSRLDSGAYVAQYLNNCFAFACWRLGRIALGYFGLVVDVGAYSNGPWAIDGLAVGVGKMETKARMTFITLLTDFGTADGYVAEVKGVLLSSAPNATIVDLSHELPPHDVAFARLTVARYWRRFPVGTVHLVVIDPGVGTERRALAVESEGRYLVGPDNGVLSPALFALDSCSVSLPVPISAAATFHARDVFAPAAAALAQGALLEDLGERCNDPVRLRTPQPHKASDGSQVGEVLAIDRFGNVVTNLRTRERGVVEAGGLRLPLVGTYGAAAVGDAVAVVGSSGFVELAVREGRGAEVLKLKVGDPVRLMAF